MGLFAFVIVAMRVAVADSNVETEHVLRTQVCVAMDAPSGAHRTTDGGVETFAEASSPRDRSMMLSRAAAVDELHPAPESATRVPAGLTAKATAWNITCDV